MAARKALGTELREVELGGRTRVAVDPQIGDEDLGRVLADLTRDDWGVDADRKGAELQLVRGDRYRQRLWRVLHEAKHPAPNKRQTHRHSIGRVLTGSIRAHPSRLDEVTATVVPGERLQVDAEGGWGRHLPLVDDLLGLPLRGDD